MYGIKLPPLPAFDRTGSTSAWHSDKAIQDYALSAVLADRAARVPEQFAAFEAWIRSKSLDQGKQAELSERGVPLARAQIDNGEFHVIQSGDDSTNPKDGMQ